MKKRIFSVFLAVCLVVTLIPSFAFAVEIPAFSDMPDDYATSALEAAVANGLITGSDGKIMPDDNLTRAQMAAIIVRAFGAVKASALDVFTDVTAADWFYSEMGKAVQMKVFQGNGSLLRPNDPISRQEVFAVLARALKLEDGSVADLVAFTDKDAVAAWAVGPTAAMVKNGFVHGADGKLYPDEKINRKNFAVLMHNIVKTYISEAKTVTELGEGSVMINAPGVTLKDITIQGDLILGDGVGDGNVTLDNVKVEGTAIVRGGGMNSIIIKGGSSIGKIIVAKVDGSVRIHAESGANVEVIIVNDGKDDVVVEGNIAKLVIEAAEVPVTVQNARIGEITVTADKANVKIDKGSSVTNMMVTGAAPSLMVAGKVDTLSASEGAEGAKIEVAMGATLDTINVSAAGTVVTGEGSVKNANIMASYVNIGTSGTKVKVAEGVTGVKAGDKELEPGKTINTDDGNPSSGGGGGGGGSSTYYLYYNANNGSGAPATQSGKSNSFIVSSTVPVRTDYLFLGWNTSSSAETASDSYKAGSAVSGTTLYAVWKSADSIISEGASTVNALPGFDYAKLSLDADRNAVTVAITDGSKSVTKVYIDIWQTLVEELIKYDLGVNSVYTGDGTNRIEVDGTAITAEQIQTFVKNSGLTGAGGGMISGSDTISCLYGQSCTVYVRPENGTAVAYSVQFSYDVDEADIDEIINIGITNVNSLTNAYAALSGSLGADDNRVTVAVKDGAKTVSDVYTDIIGTLIDELNANEEKIDYIHTNSTENKIDINGTTVDAAQIHDFVKGSGLMGEGGGPIAGADKISCLIGQSFDVHIVDVNGASYMYTISFQYDVDEADIDEIINMGITTVNSLTIDYATLSGFLETGDNSITVAITDGTKTVSDVYTDIIGTLIDELNANEAKIDYIYTNSAENKIDINGTTVDAIQIHDFVKECGLTGEGDGPIAGADKISCLIGQSFDVYIVDVNGGSYRYTIRFE